MRPRRTTGIDSLRVKVALVRFLHVSRRNKTTAISRLCTSTHSLDAKSGGWYQPEADLGFRVKVFIHREQGELVDVAMPQGRRGCRALDVSLHNLATSSIA